MTAQRRDALQGRQVLLRVRPRDRPVQPADTIQGHWYPTLTKIKNSDVWVAGGQDENGTDAVKTEMFDATGGRWKAAAEVTQNDRYWGGYPHMYLLADGRLFYAGGHTFGGPRPGTGASILDWRTGAVADVPGLRDPDRRDQAGSVLLPPAQNQRFLIRSAVRSPATSTARTTTSTAASAAPWSHMTW